MSNLQSPITSWQLTKSKTKVSFENQRILMIAPVFGNQEGLLENLSLNNIDDMTGTDSLMNLAYRNYIKYDKSSAVDGIGLFMQPSDEDTPNLAPSTTLTINGESTEKSFFTVSLLDNAFKYKINVNIDDTPVIIYEKITSQLDDIFMADIEGGSLKITLTESLEGSFLNGCLVKIEGLVNGLEFNEPRFDGGRGSVLFNNLEKTLKSLTKRYHSIIFDNSVSVDIIKKFLENRFNMKNSVMGGVGFTTFNGASALLERNLTGINSKVICAFANIHEMELVAIPLFLTTEIVAKRSLRLTDGALISNLVIDSVEAIGGISKASLPYHNTPLSYQNPSSELSLEELTTWEEKGFSFAIPTSVGGVVASLVTTYRKDKMGLKDSTFKYLNSIDTALAIQEYIFKSFKNQYGQTRISDGSVVPNTSATTLLMMRSFLVELYNDLVSYSLVKNDDTSYDFFANNIAIDFNAETGFVNIITKVNIMSQLRGVNGIIEIGYQI